MAQRDAGGNRDRDRDLGNDRGQVLVIFCLGIVALLAAAGLAFDVGRFYVERRFLQNAADAAALAAANALVRGDSDASADTQARTSLTANFANPPNGVVPALPPTTPVYASGHAGDPVYLQNGIYIAGCDVRVAIQNSVGYTFGRVVGLTSSTIGAQARAKCVGNLLPVAVRRFVNAPGPNPGSPTTCSGNQSEFMDFFATEATSCLGTETDSSLRTAAGTGSAFDSSNPDSDPTDHGPVVTILGQGAQPSNGADFRGFIALDIRNFQTATSQLYYNGITASTNNNTLKSFEAGWIAKGGYPGPMFPAATTPPDPNDQVAIMSGNSTGVAIDAVGQHFQVGDEIQVAVYPGITMAIPDFTLSDPGTVAVPTTGTVATAGSFKASRNQAFSGTVSLSTVADSLDPLNPMVTGTLLGGAAPISYTPNPVTPSLGSGQTVSMTNVSTAGAPTGIYALWIEGQAGSPYLTTKFSPFALKVGTVDRDFTITADQSTATVASGDAATFTLNVKRNGTAFGANVNLSLDSTMPWGSLPTGLGTVSFSSTSVSPTGNGTDSTLTINSGTVAPGDYTVVVRATGVNSGGYSVTHLLPLKLSIGTAASAGNQEYVDIVGFAAMRIAFADSNHVDAYAITPVIADPNDERLRRGQVARLVPWN